MQPNDISNKMDRVKLNIINLVYDPNLSADDLKYLDKFFTTAIEMEAGLDRAEHNLRAVRIHLAAHKLVQDLGSHTQTPEEST